MADKGPGPTDLIKKRINVEIRRLEYTIESQELEIEELEEKKVRLLDNIEASKLEIEKQRANLTAQNNTSGPGMVEN
jgi:hypothetical protein